MQLKAIVKSVSCIILLLVPSMIIISGILYTKKPIKESTSDLYISIYGKKIRYQVHSGGSNAVILLHGFGSSLDQWQNIMPKLMKYKIISLDLLGFGGSDRSANSYDLESQRRYIESFMQKLKIKRAVLIGTSMGASIAAWTASKSNSQKIVGLVLIAPSAYPGSLVYPFPLGWIYKPGLSNRIASFFVNNSFYKRLFPYSVAPQGISVTSSYDNKFAAALKDILQPTLLIWSPGDTKVDFEYSFAYRERIRNLEFIEIPASVGHSVTRKYQNELIGIINNYLDKIYPSEEK